ncbi:MAG TPA: polysaccharide deacetylase [Nakamurella sp.]
MTVALVGMALLTACGTSGQAADETVTNFVTPAPTSSAAPSSDPAGSQSPSDSPTPSPSPAAASSAAPADPNAAPQDGVALSDGFVPKKLQPGEKPPQFIVVSFDGVGWHEKWQHWLDIAKQVPFRFTGFLSGTYMLSDQTKMAYQGPGHGPGKSSINWNTAADLPIEISDLNQAYAAGMEIGTHFNGHFCAGAEPSGNQWSTADWNNELDQFFALVKNVKVNNPGVTMPDLAFDGSEVKGERTPCLEGHAEDLFPALTAHNMTYDSSFTRHGISWPTQSPQNQIWQFGMAEYPLHGTGHFQITMDYNFYYSQRNASSAGVSQADSDADAAQVQATYQDMYDATFNGNRAPLVLGNHFNDWNNDAYETALTNFVLASCGKQDTQCVSFRDVLAWMSVQDPARLAQLQAQAPETGSGT